VGGGGLGVKQLEKCGHALRLRWLWHHGDANKKPWKHLLRVGDQQDRHLFFCSTVMQVGNGKNTPFWESKWLHGQAPRDLAPNLYKIARFKHRSVHRELQHLRWIRNLQDISTVVQLEEFTILFMALSPIELTQERDKIFWKWTSDGQYLVASTYDC
jgi:hypothetical protein